MDIIKNLGELAFASRLKRLSERLMKDVSRIYQVLNLDFEARWFPILYTLSKQSPMAVTAVAQALGLTHTAVNQLAAEMLEKKLLLTARDKKDERRRLLRLSKKGLRLAAALKPVWKEIRLSTRELIATSGHDALVALGRIEELLDEKDMYERVLDNMGIKVTENVDIVDYRPAFKKHFKSLNYEWLQENFVVEGRDEALLSDPNGKIIKKGGAILFARMDGEIVGTCALIRHSHEIFELTKMAVTQRARRQKIGTKLALAVMDRAKAWGAKTLYLETSPKLDMAISLYKKLGFKKVHQSPLGPKRYKRKTFTMKLDF